MKTEKGITLISLTIYIIAMTIAIAVITIISNYFYTNVSDYDFNYETVGEYSRFNSFFTEEVNNRNITVENCENGYIGENGKEINYIVFSNGEQYTFIKENKGVYKNNVKICRNIELCSFLWGTENGKTTVTVTFQPEGGNIKNTKFTLKN